LERSKERVPFPGMKRPRRGADYLPLSSTEVANGLEPYVYLPSVPA